MTNNENDESSSSSPSLPQEEEILKLRSILKERPNNAKIMAKLSCLLSDTCKIKKKKNKKKFKNNGNNNVDDDEKEKEMIDKLYNEAIILARKSIQIKPKKSFGYAALSSIDDDEKINFNERMNSLKLAIQYSSSSGVDVDNNFTIFLANVGGLVRLLVEPREEEIRIMKKQNNNMTQAAVDNNNIPSKENHPSKRKLNNNEKDIYKQIKEKLLIIKKRYKLCSTTSNNKAEEKEEEEECRKRNIITNYKDLLYIIRIEYRLGIFFRKLLPPNINRLRSKNHFINTYRYCLLLTEEGKDREQQQQQQQQHKLLYEKTKFWLATFIQDEEVEDNNNNNKTEDKDDDNDNDENIINLKDIISTPPDRCPEEYVIGLYTTFADKFDNLLVNKLHYETPTLLRNLLLSSLKLKQNMNNNNKNNYKKYFHNAIDLGCGTGLSGLAFYDLIKEESSSSSSSSSSSLLEDDNNNNNADDDKQKCNTNMIGIDISKEMIQKAKNDPKRNQCYKKFIVGDIVQVLDNNNINNNKYDLIFSCDVFVYIGDLNPIFKSVRKIIKKPPNNNNNNDDDDDNNNSNNSNDDDDGGGIFAFSVERYIPASSSSSSLSSSDNNDNNNQNNNDNYILHSCARFAHSQSYIESLAKKYSFIIKKMKICPIRKNSGNDVMGILTILQAM